MEIVTGKQFKNLVRGAGLNMKAIAEISGVNQATLSRWGNDKQDIMHNGAYNKVIAAYNQLKEQL